MDNEIFLTEILPEAQRLLRRAKSAPEKQRTIFLNELKSKKYVRNEKNEVIILDESGNVAEDRHGWPLSAKNAVEELFDKYFEDNKMPRDQDEYFARLKNPKITPQERIELTVWWQENHK